MKRNRFIDGVVVLGLLMAMGLLYSGDQLLRGGLPTAQAVDKPAGREAPVQTIEEAEAELEQTIRQTDEWAQAYFRLFNDEFVAPITVSEQIEDIREDFKLGDNPIILLAQHIAGADYVISWVDDSLSVEINGTTVEVTVTEDELTRQTSWELVTPPQTANGRILKNPHPLRGVNFILASGDGSFLLQIDTPRGLYRVETSIQAEGAVTSGSSPILAPISAAKCGCKNADGNGSCSDSQCDKSDGCGTGSKGTCSWRPTMM